MNRRSPALTADAQADAFFDQPDLSRRPGAGNRLAPTSGLAADRGGIPYQRFIGRMPENIVIDKRQA